MQELRAMAGVDYRVVVGKMEEKDMLEEEERMKKNWRMRTTCQVLHLTF